MGRECTRRILSYRTPSTHPNLSVGHRQQDANGAELYIEMGSTIPFASSRRGVQAVKRSKISRLILLLTSLASS